MFYGGSGLFYSLNVIAHFIIIICISAPNYILKGGQDSREGYAICPQALFLGIKIETDKAQFEPYFHLPEKFQQINGNGSKNKIEEFLEVYGEGSLLKRRSRNNTNVENWPSIILKY